MKSSSDSRRVSSYCGAAWRAAANSVEVTMKRLVSVGAIALSLATVVWTQGRGGGRGAADSAPPPVRMNEVPGVAVNSKGHIFVFTRSNSASGPAYGPTAAQLLEFGPKGAFIREVGRQLYGWSFAHSVRIDKDDNIWAIDKGSDMIIKMNQAGRVLMVFGRRKESADGAEPWGHPNPPLPPSDGMFRQPTDVAWDSQGNI